MNLVKRRMGHGKKDPAQQPSFGMAPLLKTRFPNQAESPILSRLDPSASVVKDKLQNSKLLSEVNALATNRTSQAKAKDKPRTTLSQSTPKAFSRNTQSKQRRRGALGIKEYRLKQTVASKIILLGSDFDHQLTKPIVFSASSSMGETMDGVGSKEMKVHSVEAPLRDISNQPPSNKDMAELVAMTILNVSTAELKHIDPKLRPPKKGSEVLSSPCTAQKEDIMVQDEIPKDPTHGNYEVGSDGMQDASQHQSRFGGILLQTSGLGREGIICDSKGDWVSGYARVIGFTTSVAAELWALRDGINLCIDLNLENVIIELDAKPMVDLLMKDERSSNADVALLASLDAAGTLYERFCFVVSVS
nr:hypothetical protein CFP56_46565 [Quercus suber]